jgi:hypothetical protein
MDAPDLLPREPMPSKRSLIKGLVRLQLRGNEASGERL